VDRQEQFKVLLKSKGLKVTQQRLLILEVLESHHDTHMAVEDIYDLIHEKHPDMGLATVYRTVQLLLEMQLVDRIYLNDGCVRYELGHLFDGGSKHNHHHLICKTCNKVISFKEDLLERLEQQIERTEKFRIDDHELKFYGQCEECIEKERKQKT